MRNESMDKIIEVVHSSERFTLDAAHERVVKAIEKVNDGTEFDFDEYMSWNESATGTFAEDWENHDDND